MHPLVEEIRAIAKEMPNYEASKPGRYFHNGSPSCVVGLALSRLGLMDSSVETSLINRLPFALLVNPHDPHLPSMDTASLRWVVRVQREFDTRNGWVDLPGIVTIADDNANHHALASVVYECLSE